MTLFQEATAAMAKITIVIQMPQHCITHTTVRISFGSKIDSLSLSLFYYSKLYIKRPVLLNDQSEFSQKVSIKQPGPSQKKLIILFYFRAATANFWSLLNNLVWIFGKSLY